MSVKLTSVTGLSLTKCWAPDPLDFSSESPPILSPLFSIVSRVMSGPAVKKVCRPEMLHSPIPLSHPTARPQPSEVQASELTGPIDVPSDSRLEFSLSCGSP